MRGTSVISICIVIAVLIGWIFILMSTDERPDMMPSLAGCYLPADGNEINKVTITASGKFLYRDRETSVVPSEDKEGFSLLPKAKIVLGANGKLKFLSGHPFLLRINKDKSGFLVLSEAGESLMFWKKVC